MSSLSHDSRFDDAEGEVDYGTPWKFRDADAPNPLTIRVTGWGTGLTRLGQAEFLRGDDRDGKSWSVLVGCVVLKKRLIEGLVEEWNEDENRFALVRTEGRAQVGEVASMKFLGDREGAEGFDYPDFRVSRKPPPAATSVDDPDRNSEPPKPGTPPADDDIPF
jgi:hypothetical protein